MSADRVAAAPVIVIGSINRDHVVTVAHLPAPGETVLGNDVVLHAGGKGANQAVAVARAGVAVRLLGCVGRDDNGRFMLAELVDQGVDVDGVAVLDGVPTGAAFIAVDHNGSNQIIVSPGANAHVGDAPIGNVPEGAVAVGQLEVPIGAVAGLFEAIEFASGRTVLNPSPVPAEPSELDRVLASTDVVVLNELELRLLTGCDVDVADDASLVAASEALRRRGPRRVVATLGPAGALVLGEAPVRIPPIDVSVVDTTGAGDCFLGGLAARLALGDEIDDAARYANAAAALSTEVPGAATSIPTSAQVLVRGVL